VSSCEGNKVDGSNDVRIFGDHIQFCRRRCWPNQCRPTDVLDVRLREGIRACGVPHKISTSFPWNLTMKLDTVRSLSSTALMHNNRVYVAHTSPRCLHVFVKAQHSRSLSWLWRQWRSEPRRQDRPWWPSTVTYVAPQRHNNGTNNGSSEMKTCRYSIFS